MKWIVVGEHGSVVVENTSFAGMPTELVEHLLEGRNKGFVAEIGKESVVVVVAVAAAVVVVDFVGSKKGKRVEQKDLESKRHEAAVELGMDKVGWVC